MAHVRVQLAVAAAEPGVKERFRMWADGLSPRTRKRAAAWAGAAVTPAATTALVAYMVFSHPLVTLGNLYSFLSLQMQDWVGSLGIGLGAPGQLPWIGPIISFGQTLAASPVIAAGFGVGLVALTVMAAWILYRNVLTVNPTRGRYAYF